mmetsp:Transcript_117213/g.343316  ORF Transcript_117213/g.343316 Transcript_117213/m.343316 type:complete len:271 (+) Transcript_117213:674-1486(+)
MDGHCADGSAGWPDPGRCCRGHCHSNIWNLRWLVVARCPARPGCRVSASHPAGVAHPGGPGGCHQHLPPPREAGLADAVSFGGSTGALWWLHPRDTGDASGCEPEPSEHLFDEHVVPVAIHSCNLGVVGGAVPRVERRRALAAGHIVCGGPLAGIGASTWHVRWCLALQPPGRFQGWTPCCRPSCGLCLRSPRSAHRAHQGQHDFLCSAAVADSLLALLRRRLPPHLHGRAHDLHALVPPILLICVILPDVPSRQLLHSSGNNGRTDGVF